MPRRLNLVKYDYGIFRVHVVMIFPCNRLHLERRFKGCFASRKWPKNTVLSLYVSYKHL